MSTSNKQILETAKRWLSSDFEAKTRKEVSELIKKNDQELVDSFYKSLEFGTGGLRGIMGVGTNRMNKYTVAYATQGLANYLNHVYLHLPKKVAIAYDSRNNSPFFAQVIADVLSANDIDVYLYDELRPTPLLSYTIRELGCQSGIVVTASHNPPEYNGYKVYWEDGAQIVPPHDKLIINEVNKITSPKQVKFKGKKKLIHSVPSDVEKTYYSKVKALSYQKYFEKKGGNDLKIVYTSLHGTGITMVPTALKNHGFSKVSIVKEQEVPNGSFPTVKSPNPEEAAALKLAIDLSNKVKADVLFGTDPDTDRVGMAFRNQKGEMELLNGNQVAVLLLYYLLEQRKKSKTKEKGFIAKTIVTSNLIDAMAKAYKVDCINTLTGFKYIAEVILNLEGTKKFIGGGEESYGYLVGDFVRDKDAVISTVMLAEVAAWAKEKGKNMGQLLDEVFEKFGRFEEKLVSITKKGKAGADEITAMMEGYRKKPFKTLGGETVVEIRDFKTGVVKDVVNKRESRTGVPSSNVIQMLTNKGSLITARPSGTEPKIKFYISVNGKATKETLLKRVDKIIKDMNL